MNSSKPVLLPCTRRHRKIDKPKPATTKSQPQETPKPKLQNSERSALQVPMPLSGAALQPAETAPQPAGERKKNGPRKKKRAKNNSPPLDHNNHNHSNHGHNKDNQSNNSTNNIHSSNIKNDLYFWLCLVIKIVLVMFTVINAITILLYYAPRIFGLRFRAIRRLGLL